MKVLVGCEFSGRVRDAFIARGHEAVSCDHLPSESPLGEHIHGNLVSHRVVRRGWDLMVAHPDCTFLAVSGAKHMSIPWRKAAMEWGLAFVRTLWSFPIEKVAIENPISRLSTLWRKPDQIIQPYQFGDPYRKATCLWLRGLPKLEPTNDLGDGEPECHTEPPSVDRWKNRSRTYPGIAAAMAEQWGGA